MDKYVSWRTGCTIIMLSSMLVVGVRVEVNAFSRPQQPVQGSVEQTVTGPGGKASAQVQGNRTVQGNTASSTGSISGPQGKTVDATSSSQVQGNSATGQSTISGPRGQSANVQGTATKTLQGGNASGTATTSRGGQGTAEVTKTGESVSGSATATGAQGRSATLSGSGSQSAGSATVDTARGSAEATWDQTTTTVSGPQGNSQSVPRGTFSPRR